MPFHDRSQRFVVLHADDFGMNSAVNEGILTAFRDGLLTSTSLLANAPDADAACKAWPDLISDHQAGRLQSTPRRNETHDPAVPFDLGVHLNLTQGKPLSGDRYPAALLDARGNFPGITQVFFQLRSLSSDRLPAIELELRSQIEWMCERGIKPTHLNGHQYIELIPQIAQMIPRLLARYSIPVVRVARERGMTLSVLLQGRVKDWVLGMVKRHFAKSFRQQMQIAGIPFANTYFGTCHAGRIDLPTLQTYLRHAGKSTTIEIGLHPGRSPVDSQSYSEDPWFDPLREWRPRELEMLCSEQLGRLLQKIGWQPGRLSQMTG